MYKDSNNEFTVIFKRLQDYETMSFEEYKFSFIIVKPNGAKHISTYLEELKKWSIDILDIFAIHNHEKVNLALHLTERERSHIIPINMMFKDFYGDNAVLILIGKKNIEYSEFVSLVYKFKWKARSLVEKKYISYVFDTTDILGVNHGQYLKVLDAEGKEVKKYDMNHKGSFMVALPNSLHSPDDDVESTIKELMTIYHLGIICKNNVIPDAMIERIINYGTMEMLKDMQ
jgi:hypothetical protein